jgi:hypothetical protein
LIARPLNSPLNRRMNCTIVGEVTPNFPAKERESLACFTTH